MPEAAAAGPVRTAEDPDHDDCRPKVLLQHQQCQHAREHRHVGQEAALEVIDLRASAVDPVRDEECERELAELGRLEGAERARVEPAARAVDRHAEVRDQDQGHEQRRRNCPKRSQRPQPVIVDPAQQQQGGKTDEHPECLPLRVVEGRLVLRVCEGVARACDHHQPRSTEQCRDEQEVAIRLA